MDKTAQLTGANVARAGQPYPDAWDAGMLMASEAKITLFAYEQQQDYNPERRRSRSDGFTYGAVEESDCGLPFGHLFQELPTPQLQDSWVDKLSEWANERESAEERENEIGSEMVEVADELQDELGVSLDDLSDQIEAAVDGVRQGEGDKAQVADDLEQRLEVAVEKVKTRVMDAMANARNRANRIIHG